MFDADAPLIIIGGGNGPAGIGRKAELLLSCALHDAREGGGKSLLLYNGDRAPPSCEKSQVLRGWGFTGKNRIKMRKERRGSNGG